jgi:hypothetical protein
MYSYGGTQFVASGLDVWGRQTVCFFPETNHKSLADMDLCTVLFQQCSELVRDWSAVGQPVLAVWIIGSGSYETDAELYVKEPHKTAACARTSACANWTGRVCNFYLLNVFQSTKVGPF